MKVLVSLTDQSFAHTKSLGIFNVSMGLTRALMQNPDVRELHLLGNEECAAALGELPAHVHLHLADKKVPQRFGRIWWDQVGLPAAVRRIAPDWALLPKGFPPYFPRLGRTKLACYIHDFIWEYYSDKQSGVDTPFPPHEYRYFKCLGQRALQVCDLVLSSTQFNKSRFAAYNPQAHTEVVGIGFDEAAAPLGQDSPRGRDILFLASPIPPKRTALGFTRLQAWLAQRGDAANIRVHVLGGLPRELALPAGGAWQQAPRLPYAQLQELMRTQCRVSCYFSAYEGFGMPPVESLRMGLPCVASDIAPIRENIPASYLFNNEDESAFIGRMNAAYDAPYVPAESLPHYPNWAEVAARCVLAMKKS